MLIQLDPKYGEFSRVQQIIQLIQKNSDLAVQLASLQDSKKLQMQLQKKQEVIVIGISCVLSS
jgi:hypothetical protein